MIDDMDMTVVEGKATGQIPDTIDYSYLMDIDRKMMLDSYVPYFDLRKQGKITSVKDQGSCGSCWTFASCGSLESTLMPGQNLDLSEQNMKNLHGFDSDSCSGGNAQMATAYLSRWNGPVLESKDPYNPATSSSPSLSPIKHVQEAIFLPMRQSSLDNDAIKWALQEYGAVYASMIWSDPSYNSHNYSYYYTGSSTSGGHGVTVVGWDDNYDRNKFSPAAPSNGAFIVKNSWGGSWGENGYFYVSYYDSSFAKRNVNTVFTAEEITNYDDIYQYDPLGWCNSVGYGDSIAWGANMFTAESVEDLNAVSFYTTDSQTSYEVFVYTDPVSGPLGNLKSTVSGSFASPGYHTATLDDYVHLAKGQKFSIVVKLTTSGYRYPLAIETPLSYPYSSAATSNVGESYVSHSGTSWKDFKDTSFTQANLCIKAFTNVNQPPVLAAIGNKTVNVNSLLSFNISATDPNGDKVAYSATGLPTGAKLNASTGKFTWTPTATGKYSVKFIATANGQTDDETIWITVTTAGGNTISYTPTYDNRLRSDTPTTVLSTTTYLDIGKSTGTARDVMMFDLSSYKSTVAKATLSLYWYYPAGKTCISDTVVEVYRPVAWDPKYVTWNSNASGTPWTTAGGRWFDKNGVSQGTTPYASITFPASALPDNKYYEFDVTQLVQEYVSGKYKNTGFFLKARTESGNYIAFYSVDAANAAVRPKLTITASSGSTPTDNPPVANAGADKTATVGSDVTFDGSASTDDKGIASYSWDFDASNGITSEATTKIATKTYTAAGVYTVTLTVTDTAGQKSSDTLQVTVSNPGSTVSYMPTYDNRLRSDSPTSVLSTTTYLDIGKSTATARDLMMFDLSPYKPTDTISKATLSLYWYYPASKTRTSDNVVEVYRPVQWNPKYVTWNSNMSGVLWRKAGGDWYDKNNIPQGTTPYASVTFPAGTVPGNKYYEFDVTQLVQEYVSGKYKNTGFFLKAKAESGNYIAFYSLEYSNAAMRPKLAITR